MYVLGYYKFKYFVYLASLSYVSHFIDICIVAIKNIRNMHAVSTNQITDILYFNDKSLKTGNRRCKSGNDVIRC